jgi:hypothetical protein
MGLLRALVVVACSTSCYDPELRDCTLRCGRPHDCADGQVCGADGFCASPERAGRCAGSPPDAAVDARPDARQRDAPDEVALHVIVMGGGLVTLDGGDSCDNDCILIARAGSLVTLRALPGTKQEFSSWTSGPCVGQSDTCVFIPWVAVTIGVRFVKSG